MRLLKICLAMVAASGAALVAPCHAGASSYRVVHVFAGGSDGANPYASLTYFKGKLYGTTAGGGSYGQGTVFTLDPTTGVENVLYSFGGGSDGVEPGSGLIAVGATLYGTTVTDARSPRSATRTRPRDQVVSATR